jgi:Arc-like DNA binding domain
MVRMPPGMRDTLAELAAEHGRSMNAEVVDALARHADFWRAKEEDLTFNEEGLHAISKRLQAAAYSMETMLFDIRDIDLDAFIAHQRNQGFALTRTEAIRKILRTYLDEKGFIRHGGGPIRTPPPE